jgi:uncharacterized protein (TIRG00374 family)
MTNEKPNNTNNGDVTAPANPISADIALPLAPKKRRHLWLWNILLIVSILLGLFAMFSFGRTVEGEVSTFAEMLQSVNTRYLLVLIGMFILMFLMDTLRYLVVTVGLTGRARPLVCFKVGLLGRYYDNITPLSTGGQPMQIYYLHKKGYTGGEASAIVLVKYLNSMLCWLGLGLGLMIGNSVALNSITEPSAVFLLKLGAGFGWTISAIIPVSVLLFLVAPHATNKLVASIIGVAAKLKLVKNKLAAIKKVTRYLLEFRRAAKLLIKKPLTFLILLVVSFIYWSIMMSFPYFVMLALSSIEPSFTSLVAVTTLTAFATFSVQMIPTPGNSGVVESSVLLALGSVVTTNIFWIVLVWRFMVYYSYVLIGLGISCFEIIRTQVRRNR